MTPVNVIQIFKSTFTFSPFVDIPGISLVISAFTANILSSTGADVPPLFTWILSILGIIYLIVKIIGAILMAYSDYLDNQIKKKKLAG